MKYFEAAVVPEYDTVRANTLQRRGCGVDVEILGWLIFGFVRTMIYLYNTAFLTTQISVHVWR